MEARGASKYAQEDPVAAAIRELANAVTSAAERIAKAIEATNSGGGGV